MKPHFNTFFRAFLEAALFSTNDGDGDPLDANFSIDDIEADSLEILRAHALSFFSRMWYYVDCEEPARDFADAGHDFWLTSQGHGSGFWDGDWPKYGDMLTKLSKCYPELNLSPSDDGETLILA